MPELPDLPQDSDVKPSETAPKEKESNGTDPSFIGLDLWFAIIGGLLAVGYAGLSMMGISTSIWIGGGLFLISIVFTPFAVHRLMRSHVPRSTVSQRRAVFSVLVVVILVLFCPPFYSKYKEINRPPSADEIDETRARLLPILVIDRVNSNSVHYHFEVHNSGKLTAYDITRELTGPGMAESDWHGDLLPNAKFTLRPFMHAYPGEVFFATLLLDYRSESGNNTNTFRSIHRFRVPNAVMQPGNFLADRSELRTGNVHIFDLGKRMNVLTNGSGYFGTFFPEKESNRFHRVSFVAEPFRAFYWQPDLRGAKFETVISALTNRLILNQTFETNRSGMHRVWFTWSSNMAALSVDNKMVIFPTNYLNLVE